MLLKRRTRTDKPKIKTFQIALQAYKRVTQHMGTPLSDIDISFRKSKGFNLRSLTPQNINMSRVISVVYDPRLFLACVETSMNKYRRNSFPSQIAHNSFGTLPPFLHVLKGFWWREPKVLLQGLLKNFIPDIFSYLLLIIDKNKIVRKNVSPTFTN